MSTNYKLSKVDEFVPDDSLSKNSIWGMLKLLKPERKAFTWGIIFILLNSAATIAAPKVMGEAVNKLIAAVAAAMFAVDQAAAKVITDQGLNDVMAIALILVGIHLFATVTNYLQIRVMGKVGQRIMFNLRNRLFAKLQSLPIAFFNQNKAGDLISRINTDSEKLSQFFGEGIVQLIGNFITMIGVAITMVVIDYRLGLVALAPTIGLFIFTMSVLSVMRRRSAANLRALGSLSAEIQQSLENFKVIVAFNRRDYFRNKFGEANQKNYKAALASGIASSVNGPIYDFASRVAQLLTVVYALHLILNGQAQVGALVAYLAYLEQYYGPMRYISQLWAMMQTAIAAWGRIGEILRLETNLNTVESEADKKAKSDILMELKNVSFTYPEGAKVLTDNSIRLESGKTYAFVGPTGGGKTTTASLIARMFDPSEGEVLLEGKDIRSYTPEQRSEMIGFILQEPFLFTGTLAENIVYANPKYENLTTEEIAKKLESIDLGDLLKGFSEGLESKIESNATNLSLGQKQIIAFVRAILREPKLLILDEATANLDTVTEEVLQKIIDKLPKETTKVVIAHRLNTISNADSIFFINGGKIQEAGDLEHAIAMLSEGQKNS